MKVDACVGVAASRNLVTSQEVSQTPQRREHLLRGRCSDRVDPVGLRLRHANLRLLHTVMRFCMRSVVCCNGQKRLAAKSTDKIDGRRPLCSCVLGELSARLDALRSARWASTGADAARHNRSSQAGSCGPRAACSGMRPHNHTVALLLRPSPPAENQRGDAQLATHFNVTRQDRRNGGRRGIPSFLLSEDAPRRPCCPRIRRRCKLRHRPQ